ncbi:MAG: hypothetical protein LBK97_04475 [Prevotellaceae bacterium]|nr:hypothetical protein [Prevotellaceae bacterium]
MSPFVLEASGTAGGVMRGIGPQVIIRPADLTIGEYSGEVLQREILITVPTAYTENFVEARLGTPYESIFTMPELLLATFELNRIEDTRRVFCSELGGDFYRGILRRYGARVVNQAERLHRYRNVSNLIPLQFCSMLGEDDLLFGFAGTEIPVKETVLGAYNALVAARSEAGAAHERTPLDEQAYEQRNEKSCNCLLL